MQQNNMSFLPEDYLERRAQTRTDLISLALFAVVMAAVVAAFYVTDRQRVEVRKQQQVVNAKFEEAATRLEQLETLQKRKEQMIRKARVTGALLEPVPRSLVLAEITNCMPASMSLTELILESRTVKASRPTIVTALEAAKAAKAAAKVPGKTDKVKDAEPQPSEVLIQLVGLAMTDSLISDFMRALENSQLFEELNLTFSEETKIEDQAMRKFRVEMKLSQRVDLEKFKPLMVKRELRSDPMAGPDLRPHAPTPAATPPPRPVNLMPASDRNTIKGAPATPKKKD